jgi:hypothetical protein
MPESPPRDPRPASGDRDEPRPRLVDRRKWPTRPWDAFRLAGRRSVVRRREDRQGAFFVDRFGLPTLVLTLAVLVLSLADGMLTLVLLGLNSEEVNPLMRLLLERGEWQFLLGKYLLTAAGLPLLVAYENWPLFGTRFRVGFLLPIIAGLYLVLLAYQVHLLYL